MAWSLLDDVLDEETLVLRWPFKYESVLQDRLDLDLCIHFHWSHLGKSVQLLISKNEK